MAARLSRRILGSRCCSCRRRVNGHRRTRCRTTCTATTKANKTHRPSASGNAQGANSEHLSEWRQPPCLNEKRRRRQVLENAGAGEGNRTLVFSLEGCCSTIELHPRRLSPNTACRGSQPPRPPQISLFWPEI